MHKFFIILFLSFSSLIQAQDLDVELVKSIPNSKGIQFASFDHLDDFYLVKNNQLTKQTKEKSYNYSNLLYGEVTSIDIRNPFQILVFYKDFQSFVVLDNQLNEISNVNFSVQFPELDVISVSASNKNQYWVLDGISRRIFIFDAGQNILKPVSVPFENKFSDWNSNANSFFIESNQIIYTFDIYGKVSQNPFSTKFDKIDLISSTTFISQYSQDLFYHNLDSNQNLKINLKNNNIVSFQINNEILTIFTDTEINIYKLKLP